MTVEESKKELREYRDNIRYLEQKQEDAEELRCKLEKMTTTLSETKTSNGNSEADKFSDGISRMQAIEKDCREKIQELLLKKFIVDDKIDKLEEPFRSILFFRYARGKSWNEIASDLGYCLRDLYRKHGKALRIYSEL